MERVVHDHAGLNSSVEQTVPGKAVGVAGKVPCCRMVTKGMVRGVPVVEHWPDGALSRSISKICARVPRQLDKNGTSSTSHSWKDFAE